jgi:hypothetical protein
VLPDEVVVGVELLPLAVVEARGAAGSLVSLETDANIVKVLGVKKVTLERVDARVPAATFSPALL